MRQVLQIAFLLTASLAAGAVAQVPPAPPAMAIPAPGPATRQPYAPQSLLPGGIVMPLFPPGSP